jgi:hypothetical protein
MAVAEHAMHADLLFDRCRVRALLKITVAIKVAISPAPLA